MFADRRDVLPARACRNAPRRPVAGDGLRRGARRISDVPDDFGAFTTVIAPTALCRESGPRYGALRVDDPGELIAALPAMVGFVPECSLVVAVLRPGPSPTIEAVVRFDLGDGGHERIETYAACLAQICSVEGAREVLAVVVDDRLPEPVGPHRAPRPGPASALPDDRAPGRVVTALDKQLARRGIEVSGAWAVCAIETGRWWWNLFDPGERGVVADPTASPVALAQVLDGRTIHRSRAELTALLARDDELSERVAARLGAATDAAHDRFTRAVRHDDLDHYRRNIVEYALWQVANAESGAELGDTEIARLVVGLRDQVVRDSLFALAIGEHAAAAEDVWLTMVRASSGSDRADAAVLLAYSAYVRGDGPFAGIALDTALTAEPVHSLAQLLETALRNGLRPESLRRLGRSGHATAAGLGLDLGPEAL
ncbi:DUF4192 domain-containing protein [Nocardia sp. NEAU-351]|uniref:DUF4192 domain-containing protein n=2 Tax=Nocardia bovistercoris TaxID=2785916 RepID=A0A931I5C0_9NOCA|nr:DUF4192 domain-containing protein [Nocardia bovistercoris]